LRKLSNKVYFVVFLLVFLLIPGQILANQLSPEEPSFVPPGRNLTAPKLADVIPMATGLSTRFVRLENDLKGTLDIASIEKKYALITVDLSDLPGRLQNMQQQKNSQSLKVIDFASFKRIINNKKLQLVALGRPLKGEIRRLDGWRLNWLAEKELWADWKTSLLNGREIKQLELTFTGINNTIDAALVQIRQQLEATLALQFKIFTAWGKLDLLVADLVSEARQGHLSDQSPPILSSEYISRYATGEVWSAAWEGLRLALNPEGYSIALHGWNLLLQILFLLLVLGVIHKNRDELKKSERWEFLSDRPVSASLFIVILVSILFLSYLPNREALSTAYLVVGGIACARILGKVIESLWKRQALYGVMITFVINEILFRINLPQPLFRLYIFFVCLFAFYFFMRWNRETSSQHEASYYLWLLRLGYGSTLFILLAELFGKVGLSSYLFRSITLSIALTFPCLLLMYMIYGGLHWVFFSSPVWQVKLLRNDAESLVRKVGFLFLTTMILFAILPGLLVAWDVYDSAFVATSRVLSLGFFIGTLWISVGTILASVAVFYIAILTSHILPKVLLDEVVTGQKMQRGVQNSIGKLIRYSIVFIGILFAFMALGFDFTKLTIIMGALGVGIGFGLQGIVNNFVSGLILLFERPLREGDTIELGEKSARIKKIGLRATIVETFDQADVIIPNADLINNRVINWTLANRQVRLSVPVGVAYGSDVSLVVETLLACAKQHEEVAKSPTPEVLFLNFGESSLDFELRVWIPDADLRLRVRSDLYHAIEQVFRESDIEIPFPQMDLHLRETEGVTTTISTETAL